MSRAAFGKEAEFSGRGAATPPVLPYDIACVFVRKYETNRRDSGLTKPTPGRIAGPASEQFGWEGRGTVRVYSHRTG